MIKRMYIVKGYVAHLEGQKMKNPIVKPNLLKELKPDSPSNAKAWYIDKIKMFLDNETYDIDNVSDMSLLLFKLIVDVEEAYLDEKALYINFILTSLQNTRLSKRQEMKEFLRFIRDESDILSALGIDITIPPTSSIESSY